ETASFRSAFRLTADCADYTDETSDPKHRLTKSDCTSLPYPCNPRNPRLICSVFIRGYCSMSQAIERRPQHWHGLRISLTRGEGPWPSQTGGLFKIRVAGPLQLKLTAVQ